MYQTNQLPKSNDKSLENGDIRYRTLFENANDAILLMDRDRFIECNPKTIEIFGCSKEEIIGQTPYFLSPNIQSDGRDSKEKALEKINAALAGTPQRFEWTHKTCNGNIFETEVSLNVITLGGKNYLQAIVRDITEQNKIRHDLEASEAKYRALFENTNEAIIVMQDDKIKFFNPRTLEMLGYTERELLNKPLKDLFHPDNRDLAINRMHSRQRGEKLPSLDKLRLIDKNGDTVWVQNNCVIIDWDRRPASLSFCTDITEQQKVQRDLLREKSLSERMISSAPNIIIALGTDSKILLFNEFAEKLTGYKAQEVLGKRWIDVFIPYEIQDTIRDIFTQVVEKREIQHHYENEILTKSDERKLISWSNTVITENSHFSMVLSIGEDITAQKKSEEALRENEKRLRDLFEAMPLGMHMYELKGNGDLVFTRSNKSADDILNLNNSQFIGKTIEEAFPAHIGSEVPERYKEIAAHGGTWRREDLFYQQGKIQGVFDVIAFQISPNKLVALFQDTTERKKIEDRVKSSEQRFRELSELLPQTVFEIDIQGNITYTNKFGLTMFGYTQEEVDKGFTATQLLAKPDQQRLKDNIAKALNGEEFSDHEYIAIRKDGKLFPTLVYCSPIIKDGKPSGLRGVLIDITTQKKIEQELKDKLEELERTTRLMVGRELKMVELKEMMEKIKQEQETDSTTSQPQS